MNGGGGGSTREEAAAVMTKYLMLTSEGKRIFDELHREVVRLPPPPPVSMPWTNGMAATTLFLPASPSPPLQQLQQHSDPRHILVKSAAVAATTHKEEQEEEEEDDDQVELSEQSLDERCLNVCTPAPNKECACRYKFTDTEESAPALDPKAVAIFFPNREHSELDEDALIAYVKEQSKAKPSLIASMDAYTGRYYKRKWVIPYVVVYCKTHERAVRFYTLMRKAIAKNGLSISLNWGRKRN